jgi:hypothetical protein
VVGRRPSGSSLSPFLQQASSLGGQVTGFCPSASRQVGQEHDCLGGCGVPLIGCSASLILALGRQQSGLCGGWRRRPRRWNVPRLRSGAASDRLWPGVVRGGGGSYSRSAQACAGVLRRFEDDSRPWSIKRSVRQLASRWTRINLCSLLQQSTLMGPWDPWPHQCSRRTPGAKEEMGLIRPIPLSFPESLPLLACMWSPSYHDHRVVRGPRIAPTHRVLCGPYPVSDRSP